MDNSVPLAVWWLVDMHDMKEFHDLANVRVKLNAYVSELELVPVDIIGGEVGNTTLRGGIVCIL